MDIQINTANNVDGREALTQEVEETVRTRLARFSERLTRVEVHIHDENGDRNAVHDKRCVIEARPAGHDPISVTDQADSIDQATAGALSKMATALDRTFGKMTDRKGH
ncbi:MAG: HPF/RaiA family ribosome-associated protein [Brevundimonas sp.]